MKELTEQTKIFVYYSFHDFICKSIPNDLKDLWTFFLLINQNTNLSIETKDFEMPFKKSTVFHVVND